MRILALIVVPCAILAFASCGEDSSAGPTTESTVSSAPSADRPAGRAQNPPLPHVTPPAGPPPKRVVARDIKEGSGAALKVGDEFTVRYVSFGYNGEKAEDHWSDGSTFSWIFEPGKLVRAWTLGLPGIKVGGRRELIAPSRLAYGGGAMIWVVELLSIDK